MQFWKDADEPIHFFVKMFEEAMKEQDLVEGVKKVNQLILFDYTANGPDCCFWLDCRNGQAMVGPGHPEGKPDLIMSLNADDAHRAWSNKLNPVIAITTRKIKVKGSPAGLLKLVPKMGKLAEIYCGVLKSEGREDLILK